MLEKLINQFKTSPQFSQVIRQYNLAEQEIYVAGLPGSAKTILLYSLILELKKPLLIVTRDQETAEKTFDELKDLIKVYYFAPDLELEHINILNKLLNGESQTIIISAKELQAGTLSKQFIKSSSVKIYTHKPAPWGVDLNRLAEHLIKIGYKRTAMVEEIGEFSIRGGIVDVFTPGRENPLRIELFGSIVESIREFEIPTQRSILECSEAVILPSSQNQEGTLLEYLTCDWLVFEDEPTQMNLDFQNFRRVLCSRVPLSAENSINFEIAALQSFVGEISKISAEFQNYRVYFVSVQPERLKEILSAEGICGEVFEGCLQSGFVDKGSKLALITDREIFGEVFIHGKYKSQITLGADPALLADFKTDDFVVHKAYGIGSYRGLKKINIENVEQEYILIEFADEDYLYIPPDQMKKIHKYTAPGEKAPALNRLRDNTWLRTTEKARKSTAELAKELLELYSYREKGKGFAFPPDTAWQVELEKSFPYVETKDQIIAIDEVKRDMEAEKPMERILCGDVGYGKTEVALRAAFKAASAGKQTVILVPTTILAEQHYNTFAERLKPFPVIVEMLSRFKNKAEQKQIINSLKTGGIDIIIGTHRLLQNDVQFKELGLLVIDEEQRFGVKHKEKLKKLKQNVDTLTLSATPIPRTLYMAMSGIREMSTINTPPAGRLSIHTQLAPWDKNLIRQAIEKEIERGGQVFFIHNFIEGIEDTSAYIHKLVPQARVVVAHGQMRPKQLEEVIYKFIKREYDILISTSIIESGLDMPNVNTIIINQAERFGLADLYQLRGRVGRGNVPAYAYLLYKPGSLTTENIFKRLSAIKEFTTLGSGYRLAMKDLELRGAGNLLGREQHGHLISVGFEFYTDLLKESVAQLKGTPPKKPREVSIDLKIDLFIPADYIEDEKQRISYYKRLYNVETLYALEDIQKEMVDRFGGLPAVMNNLFEVLKIKLAAEGAGVKSIAVRDHKIEIEYLEAAKKIIDCGTNPISVLKEFFNQALK